MHPYLDTPGPIAFAHRGGNRAAPENTMEAFEHAVSLGYRYLETDVHLTADGVLAAFHDADLTRTCGIERNIAAMSVAEVADARIDGTHEIPLMEDLFRRFPDARFNIDAKSEASVEPLAALVQELDVIDRICLASFSWRSLARLRKLLGPRLLTNLSPQEVVGLRVIGRLPHRSPRAAQVPTRSGRLTIVNERFLASAHRADIAVHVWTINDRPEMERLLDLGVDGIMTDDTELLRDVYAERGLWPD
ncbi:MAG: glycerophosphodiester phosphodiesterase [Ilumatobacter sp.]|nr:glycerophosphodiester phosphodiesterase [Ilumatobacter sp.]